MKRAFIIIGLLSLLVAFLFIGSPIEFLNPRTDQIATKIFGVAIIGIFLFLVRKGLRLEHKVVKILVLLFTGFLALPYLFMSLFVGFLNFSSDHPTWEDTGIYTNATGEKVISQFRRTSGSIYDYRYRKVYKEYDGIRISLYWPDSRMKGRWKVYGIADNTSEVIDFDKRN